MLSKKNSGKLLDKQIENAQKQYAELMINVRKVESTIRFLVDKKYNKESK